MRSTHLPLPLGSLGFPGGSDGKESACNAGDLGSIPGLGRSPEGGQGNPLQYSGVCVCIYICVYIYIYIYIYIYRERERERERERAQR